MNLVNLRKPYRAKRMGRFKKKLRYVEGITSYQGPSGE